MAVPEPETPRNGVLSLKLRLQLPNALPCLLGTDTHPEPLLASGMITAELGTVCGFRRATRGAITAALILRSGAVFRGIAVSASSGTCLPAIGGLATILGQRPDPDGRHFHDTAVANHGSFGSTLNDTRHPGCNVAGVVPSR
jgi:hypothetical protein